MTAEEFVSLYQRRQAQFNEQLQEVDDPYLRELVQQCIWHTDLCVLVFQDLAPIFAEVFERNKSHAEESVRNLDKLETTARDMFSNAGSILDEHAKVRAMEEAKYIIEMLRNSQLNSIDLSLALNDLNDLMIDRFHDSLVYGILSSGDGEAALNAVLEFVQFLIGCVPVLGNVFGGFVAIVNILIARKRDARDANSFLKNCKSYIAAAYYWSVSAQIFIEGMSDDDQANEEKRLEGAIQIIEQRLATITS